MDDALASLAVLAADRLDGRTVATAESFTAGLVAQALAGVEGSTEWFLGSVVAYHERTKHQLLGVSPGPVVCEAAAAEMAAGAARLLHADVGVATTGVAGPADQDGRAPGTVVIGWYRRVDGVESCGADTLSLPGEPEQVIRAGARAALSRLAAVLA